jgi:DNA polymerase-3 subunit epsilon
MNFVALDFETTGLNPHRSRVVEVAAVVFAPSGEVIDEFDSLVNPESTLGAASVHGILDIDLVDAPRFRDLIPRLSGFLDGKVIVAHNAPFDLKFLERELEIAQVEIAEISGLCTLTMLTRYFPSAPRRLAESCAHFGLPVLSSHQAINDARMTASLAAYLLRQVGDLPIPYSCSLGFQAHHSEQICKPLPRRKASVPDEEVTFLSRLVQELPAVSLVDQLGSEAFGRYLDLLDRMLEDRNLTEDEALALFELADDEGLSQESIATIHHSYFLNLLKIANSDHYLSVAERSDLRKVAQILSIGDWQKYVDEATEIDVWKSGIPDRKPLGEAVSSDFLDFEATLDFGDPEVSQILKDRSIVITGEFAEFSREQGQEAVVRRGGKATSSISKRTYALIAGSGAGPSKLERASSMGVPILNFEEFRKLLQSGTLPKS